ncbi:hypothetical protein D9757_010798 [Collybiopsis confluens]|uniref:G domain-containing protein n=1 Tax=Collybiopsis confluens TaxID=2823264 RepID=A0A8H5LV24_9AGAR|nr:hypothetical protein D9757_010798 [Collybiopsis confluens]
MTGFELGNEAPNGDFLSRAGCNILLFGASGSGKSSIVNMLLPDPHAIATDNAAEAPRFQAKPYQVQVKDNSFSIFDLTGLSNKHSYSPAAARTALDTFLQDFSKKGMRLHLLVQCIRAPRFAKILEIEYTLFHHTICKQQVPIVTIITGLEDYEPDMESWWKNNHDTFDSHHMTFAGHACITATRGRQRAAGFAYEQEYNQSVGIVRDLLCQNAVPYHEGWELDMESYRNSLINLDRPQSGSETLPIAVSISSAPLPQLFPYSFELPLLSEKAQVEKNVILFGSTGCGKSSVVNMLLAPDCTAKAKVTSEARGCTFESQAYNIEIKNSKYKVWDTAGLDEGSHGAVCSLAASQNICRLIREVSRDSSGISLLVFVVRAPRITENLQKNYEIFYQGFCEEEVPIVIVVTGLENEENMDEWWESNEKHFTERNMVFDGAGCITTTVGTLIPELGRFVHQKAYELSTQKVRELISQNCAQEGWKKIPEFWTLEFWKWLLKFLNEKSKITHESMFKTIQETMGSTISLPRTFDQASPNILVRAWDTVWRRSKPSEKEGGWGQNR